MCSFTSTQILSYNAAYETEYTAEGKTVQVPLCMLVRQFAFGQVCLLVRVGDGRLSLHSNKMKGC